MTLINQSTLIKKFYLRKKFWVSTYIEQQPQEKQRLHFNLTKKQNQIFIASILPKKNKFMHALITDSSIKTSLRNNSTIYIYTLIN